MTSKLSIQQTGSSWVCQIQRSSNSRISPYQSANSHSSLRSYL